MKSILVILLFSMFIRAAINVQECDRMQHHLSSCFWFTKAYYNWWVFDVQKEPTCATHVSALLELAYSIVDNPAESYAVSIQSVIDCFSDGCTPKSIMDKILEAYVPRKGMRQRGLLLNKRLYRAYDGLKHTCDPFSGWDERPFNYSIGLWQNLQWMEIQLNSGPFITTMMVRQNFRKFVHTESIYTAIYKPYEDQSHFLEGFHGLLVVGMEKRLDGSYLLFVRNSWELDDCRIWGYKNHAVIQFRNNEDMRAIAFGENIFSIIGIESPPPPPSSFSFC